VDAQNNNLAFYCKYSTNGKEPFDQALIEKQMQNTFEKQFGFK
jgi:hypothetical protein